MFDYLTQNEKEEMVLESTLDIAMNRGIYMYESVIKRNEINLKEAELKVITESGSQEDLNVLYEAANEEVVEKKRNVLLKMIDAIKAFIDTVITKIKSVFTKQVIEDAKKVAATAPDIEVNGDPKTVFAKLKGKIEDVFNTITHPGASLKKWNALDKEEADHKLTKVRHKATLVTSVAGLAVAYVLSNMPKMMDAAKKSVENSKIEDPDGSTKIKYLHTLVKEMISFTNGMIDHTKSIATYAVTGSNSKIRGQLNDNFIAGRDYGERRGWNNGFKEGRVNGYKDGKIDGYDKAKNKVSNK